MPSRPRVGADPPGRPPDVVDLRRVARGVVLGQSIADRDRDVARPGEPLAHLALARLVPLDPPPAVDQEDARASGRIEAAGR